MNSVFNNILIQLEARILVSANLHNDSSIIGNISVATDYHGSLNNSYNKTDIVITGDIFPLIEKLLEYNVGMIIICSETVIPEEIVNTAQAKNIAVIQTNKDTYAVSKIIIFICYSYGVK